MFRHEIETILALALAAPLVGAAVAPASHGLLLVANKGDQTIAIIDPEAGREIATIKESGFTVHEVIASPDGRTAYAPVYGNFVQHHYGYVSSYYYPPATTTETTQTSETTPQQTSPTPPTVEPAAPSHAPKPAPPRGPPAAPPPQRPTPDG